MVLNQVLVFAIGLLTGYVSACVIVRHKRGRPRDQADICQGWQAIRNALEDYWAGAEFARHFEISPLSCDDPRVARFEIHALTVHGEERLQEMYLDSEKESD